jgi:hypothetical protein
LVTVKVRVVSFHITMSTFIDAPFTVPVNSYRSTLKCTVLPLSIPPSISPTREPSALTVPANPLSLS